MAPLRFLCLTSLVLASALPVAAQERDTSGEGQILARINGMRNAVGVAALQRHQGLDAAAASHSADMAQHQSLAHVSPRTGDPADRVGAAGVQAALVAENIALEQSALDAHRALVRSDAHRSNMMNPELTHIGIAVVSAAQGVYVTEVFARIGDDASAVPPVPELVPPSPPPVPPTISESQEPSAVAAPAPPPAPSPSPQAAPAPAAEAPASAPTRQVTGYWVLANGRWWYYPLPPGSQPGQVLSPDLRVQGPPPPGSVGQPAWGQSGAGYTTHPAYNVTVGAGVAPMHQQAPAFGWSPRRHYRQWSSGR